MYTIRGYEKVKSLEEAYEANQKKSSSIIGGGMWLRLGSKNIGSAIDLTDLGMDQIEETEDAFIIGCMTSLREIECHPGMNRYFHGMMKETMKGIVGTQFRNTATIGGSIYQRFGFSDPLTAFLALDTTVEMYAGGMIPLDDFVSMAYDRDILVRIHVKKDGRKAAYQSFRNTKTDFPVVTVGVSKSEAGWKVSVGARPGRAEVFQAVHPLSDEPEEEEIKQFAKEISEAAVFGSNMRASAEYRKLLTEVLVGRAVEDICLQLKGDTQEGLKR